MKRSLAMQTNFHTDLRRENSDLFSQLPAVFLLSLSPDQLQQPAWRTRIAGLIMVNVDPNLQASSFVQGWAMEDPKQQKEGPGVAYEFLWADPYLPGLGYFNMEPWVYLRDSGFLIARSNWEPRGVLHQTDARKIRISALRAEFSKPSDEFRQVAAAADQRAVHFREVGPESNHDPVRAEGRVRGLVENRRKYTNRHR